METKSLLFGLIGFFLGGLLVSVAATTFSKPNDASTSDMSMSQMADALKGRQGDDYDKVFIAGMIEHHQGAVEMAELSANNAKHDEIKQLSKEIIAAQEKEIAQMQRWQKDWGYTAAEAMHPTNH